MGEVVQLKNDKKSAQERLNDFANEYANNNGDHIAAYISAGFSADTAKHNAKKYLDKHSEFVMGIVKRSRLQKSGKYLGVLESCMSDETVPWANRLKAMEMFFKVTGFSKDALVIEDQKANELSPEQREAEILALKEKLFKNA